MALPAWSNYQTCSGVCSVIFCLQIKGSIFCKCVFCNLSFVFCLVHRFVNNRLYGYSSWIVRIFFLCGMDRYYIRKSSSLKSMEKSP